ncbi:MAG: glycosyltransferase family 2 protein, partial [Parasporobacterium sp.]|nr:glycosyltransferase family 2 protein [Parasporobacterium sp.]
MISIQPIISIIIPVFNAIESLERCVESVVYGSFRDIELILIDDCSTDGSWKLCQILSEKYSNVYSFHNSENKGVSFTRNWGLQQVKSDYVMFIDSDDWVSGKYVQSLFDIIIQYPECLPICGYFLVDQITGKKETYIFQNKDRGSDLFETEDLFDLSANVQIQQLWNKLFRRDIIEKYKIQFDEQQSMGEDFQFVLDYLNASGIKKCVVLPKPLYYYVRANNDSLMSKFGMIETENEYKRLKQMLVLCGEENAAYKNKYIQTVEMAKLNHVYRICRSSLLKKREKLDLIEKEMNDSHAAAYYRQQKKQLFKENLLDMKKAITRLPKRLRGKLIRTRNARIISRADALLKNRDFSLISQNCIGGVF